MAVAPPNLGSLGSNQQLYPRRFELLVVGSGGQSIYSTDSSFAPLATLNGQNLSAAVDCSSLKCTFHIHKTINILQTAEITIYNLSAQTETNIWKNATDVILSAGYVNGPWGVIFQGRIVQPVRGKENGTDYYLRLVCSSGDQLLQTGIGNNTYGSQQLKTMLAQQVCRDASVPFDLQVDPKLQAQDNQAMPRGKTIFGRPRDYLRRIALSQGASFYVDAGQAKMTLFNTDPPAIVPVLNYLTGMVGIPHQTDNGVEVRSLINPNFNIDSWVNLNNHDINAFQVSLPNNPYPYPLDQDGLYHIIGMDITGDTRGNDWYMDLVTLPQQTNTPSSLPFATYSAY
jgi:hypothetical protein